MYFFYIMKWYSDFLIGGGSECLGDPEQASYHLHLSNVDIKKSLLL